MEPIHKAAWNADVEALRRVLGEGVSANLKSDGCVPLHHLCSDDQGDSDNRVVCFKLLVDAGADVNAEISPTRSTPLSFAAGYGHPKLVAALINAGANVNCHNSAGWTPLHFACRRHPPSVECVELLLNAGAAVNATTNCRAPRRTPLDIAINRGTQERIYPTLLRAGATHSQETTDAYLQKVRAAGGIENYERAHLATLTATFTSKLRLPARPTRRVVEYAFHAGDY